MTVTTKYFSVWKDSKDMGPRGFPGPDGTAVQGTSGTSVQGSAGVSVQGSAGASVQGSAGSTIQGQQGDAIQGQQGDFIQGQMGSQGIQGRVGAGITWLGEWYNDVNYIVGNGVSYNGASYICIQANINKPPDSEPSYWECFAEKGDQGIQGQASIVQGPQGAIGTGTQGQMGTQGEQGTPGVTAGTGEPTGGVNGDVYYQYQ